MSRKKIVISSFIVLGLICVGLSQYYHRCMVRKHILRAFKIPTSTMHPTLRKGDRILVDTLHKYVPKRGDVIVFRYPRDRNRSFVKRLIALGGESVEIKDGHIYINGDKLKGPPFHKLRYVSLGEFGIEGKPFVVPDGSLFVLGDNSENSRDSRYFGSVPQYDVIGKAYKIYWPLSRIGPIE